MNRRPLRPIVVAVLALVSASPFAAAVGGAARDAPSDALFAVDEPLVLELAFDRRALCRPRRGCASIPATLTYESNGRRSTVTIRVRARGLWRNDHCDVPPLFVELDGTAAGPFAGHRQLPLTTHCRTSSRVYEQYVLKEYLAYRLYGLFGDKSLRVRLARITYRDTGKRPRAVVRHGFFVEHFEAFAARHGAELKAADEFRLHEGNANEIAALALFQYMIGNSDWSAIAGHNTVHLRADMGSVAVVPFDFDFSGLVDAAYATPPPNLPVRSVRQRVFRGFCDREVDWEALFTRFAIRRDAVYRLIGQIPALAPAQKADVRAYLDAFYAVVDSPNERREKIVEACRPSPSEHVDRPLRSRAAEAYTRDTPEPRQQLLRSGLFLP